MAIDLTIHVRASRAEVLDIIRSLPAVAAGNPGAWEQSQALLVRMGLAALGHIKTAFLVKARGGTDETGLKWPPLSPKTIAYSRRHPGLPKKSVRAADRPSWMLTDTQREAWWDDYRRFYSHYGDKSRAAAGAWYLAKLAGARTIMGVYGQTRVEILRDTDVLFNSLTPGCPPAQAQHAPPPVPEQIFRVGQGEVIIGTSRKWAWTHHYGVPGHIPRRRLWPEPSRWPSDWWLSILEQGQQGLVDIALYMLGRS